MLTAVGIALFLGFVALGAWQVQRLSWKLDLIERVEQRLKAPPHTCSAASGSTEYR
jgi:surfeit locus 1 family protein